MTRTYFVGIGIDKYDNGRDLRYAVVDVQTVAALLDDRFERSVLTDPDENTVRKCLRDLRGSMRDGGMLVLMWGGHAFRSPADGLRLLARDSGNYLSDGLAATSDVAAPCAESGASQLLFIIDTCHSGEAVPAAEAANRILQETAIRKEHLWTGVLTSCLPTSIAWDGLFGRHLCKLLREGPESAELRVRWSPHNVFIRGDDLCDAVVKEWSEPHQTPYFASHGSAHCP